VVVLLTGATVLLYGVRPRLTVAASVAVAVTAYLVQLIGPALHWPGWILDTSPFHHLAAVPARSFAPVSAAVMTAIGLALMAAGVAAFDRRDIVAA
jgi:ABC-2 type transport system permease protein